jgi:hypothetical protein
MKRILQRALTLPLAALPLLLTQERASAQIMACATESGQISLSTDGDGAFGPSTLSYLKPAGATVRKAYLAASSNFFYTIVDGDVVLNGTPVMWDKTVLNDVVGLPGFFVNVFADVTAIVKPTLDGAAAGAGTVSVDEDPFATGSIDGEAFAVIWDDPNVPLTQSNGVIIFFGGQALAGDTFNINLAEPLDLADPATKLELGLGIGFGFQGPFGGTGQVSEICVNGLPLTKSAGGEDDGSGANGALITVGGLGDSTANPAPCDPPTSFSFDDELYDLLPFYVANSTLVVVDTFNPSNDDNIFWATLCTSVPAVTQGILLSPLAETNVVGDDHTVTACVIDSNGNPVSGVTVTFTVISGPNAGANGMAVTGADGKASFTYTSNGMEGTDCIQASFVDAMGETQLSNIVKKFWQEQCMLVVGDGTGTGTFTPAGHTFVTQVGAPQDFRPMLLDNLAELTFSLPEPPAAQGKILKTPFPGRSLLHSFTVQGLMWNTALSQAEQHSKGVAVLVFTDGHVRATQYGNASGMTIDVETEIIQPGAGSLRQVKVRFPFTITF